MCATLAISSGGKHKIFREQYIFETKIFLIKVIEFEDDHASDKLLDLINKNQPQPYYK